MSVPSSTQAIRPPSPKQLKNEEALRVYAAFLCALITLAVLAHRLSQYTIRYPGPKSSNGLPSLGFKILQKSSRLIRRRINLGWLGRFQYGLVALAGIYVVGNTALSSTILAGHRLNFWASRLGWMAAANTVLCVAMAIKNTPLALFTIFSHAQLNIIHRIVGYTTGLLVILHASLYTTFFGQYGRWTTLLKPSNLAGIGAGIAMIVLLMGFFRHRNYTIFYISHILGFTILVPLVWLHRPDWAKKLPYVAVISGCIWMLDRTIRLCTLGFNFVSNTATLYPLPDGGTRIIIAKPLAPAGALAGLHYYLWLPRFRFYAAHPFTVVNNGPEGVELVMKSHQGFSKAVGNYSVRLPGRSLWASMHGPYGSRPDVEGYGRIVFICGGSGGAFMFGLLNYMMNRPECLVSQRVKAIWAVRREEHLDWFSDHLHSLVTVKGCIEVTLFVTDASLSSIQAGSLARVTRLSEPDVESALLRNPGAADYDTIPKVDTAVNSHLVASGLSVNFTKLKVDRVMETALEGTRPHEHILVATCGPTSLMDAVKDFAELWQEHKGLRIDVHSEDFNT